MKRFVKIYATLFIVCVVLANLVVVFLYGKQFLLQASEGAVRADVTLTETLLLINGLLVGLFVLLWWLSRYVYRQHAPREY